MFFSKKVEMTVEEFSKVKEYIKELADENAMLKLKAEQNSYRTEAIRLREENIRLSEEIGKLKAENKKQKATISTVLQKLNESVTLCEEFAVRSRVNVKSTDFYA